MNKNDSFLRKNCTLLSCCAVFIMLIAGIFMLYRYNTQSTSIRAPHVVKKSKAEKPITDNITIKPNYIGKTLLKGQ